MIKLSNAAHSAKSLKLYTSVLTMALAVTLVGCNSSDSAEGEESSSSENVQETQEEAPEPTEEELAEKEDEEAEAEGGIAIGDNDYEEVTLVEAIDGNNVVVETENGQETIRLAGLNAPTEGDYGHTRGAKEWAEPRHAIGETVRLVRAIPSENEEGESLGYIWYEGEFDKTHNINYKIIHGGLAQFDPDLEDERYRDRLEEAEEIPRNGGLYIWHTEGFVTEDGGYNYEALDEDERHP